MTKNLTLFLFFIVMLLGCQKSTSPAESIEAVPQAQAAVQPVTPPASNSSAPAQPAEIEDVANRIFGNAAVADPAAPFVTGDFNGDGYQDIAFTLRANKEIVKENTTGLANWIAEDPAHVQLPELGKSVQALPPAPPPLHLRSGEPLVAIVHGIGPRGWRDPQARQTFLLAGNLPANPAALPISKFPALANDPRFTHLSRELIRGDGNHCLFWTGAWYVVQAVARSSSATAP